MSGFVRLRETTGYHNYECVACGGLIEIGESHQVHTTSKRVEGRNVADRRRYHNDCRHLAVSRAPGRRRLQDRPINPESAWANYVRDLRTRLHLQRRELAERVDVNASYVTLWERDGRAPRRPIVERLAKEFGLPIEESLIAAGYSPLISRQANTARVLDKRLAAFQKPLYQAIMRLADLSPKQQQDVARLLDVFVDSLRSEAIARFEAREPGL